MENIHFTCKIPVHLSEAIQNGETSICRQFLSDEREKIYHSEELEDPIGDFQSTVFPGVIHRYNDRLLILLARRCAGHCRFCFRKIQVSQEIPDMTKIEFQKIIQYLQENTNIREVILSGGEPFLIENALLQEIFLHLDRIQSVRTFRIHTRLPIFNPKRFDDNLLQILENIEKPIWIVIHVNCIQEITPEVRLVIRKLTKLGIPLLSQSVLLRGVNDTVSSLEELFSCLIENRIKPYYLHYPDLVPGTSHFRIPLEKAIQLVEQLRGKISGFGIPDLIVDIPNGHGKIVLSPQWAKQLDDSTWEFISPITQKKIIVRYPIFVDD